MKARRSPKCDFFFFSRHRDETAKRRHRQSRTQQPQLMMRFIKHSPTHTQMNRGRFFVFVKIASKTFPSDYTFLPRHLLLVLRSSSKLSSRATFPSSFSIKAASDFHASGCKNEGGKGKQTRSNRHSSRLHYDFMKFCCDNFNSRRLAHHSAEICNSYSDNCEHIPADTFAPPPTLPNRCHQT